VSGLGDVGNPRGTRIAEKGLKLQQKLGNIYYEKMSPSQN